MLEYIEADSFEVQTLHVYEKQIPHKIHLCNTTSTAVLEGIFVIIQYIIFAALYAIMEPIKRCASLFAMWRDRLTVTH